MTPATIGPSATDAHTTPGMIRTILDHRGAESCFFREHRTATATRAPRARAAPINHWETPVKSPPRQLALCAPTATSPIPMAATAASIPNRESKVSHRGVDESWTGGSIPHQSALETSGLTRTDENRCYGSPNEFQRKQWPRQSRGAATRWPVGVRRLILLPHG